MLPLNNLNLGLVNNTNGATGTSAGTDTTSAPADRAPVKGHSDMSDIDNQNLGLVNDDCSADGTDLDDRRERLLERLEDIREVVTLLDETLTTMEPQEFAMTIGDAIDGDLAGALARLEADLAPSRKHGRIRYQGMLIAWGGEEVLEILQELAAMGAAA
jgi:hypothetical protein